MTAPPDDRQPDDAQSDDAQSDDAQSDDAQSDDALRRPVRLQGLELELPERGTGVRAARRAAAAAREATARATPGRTLADAGVTGQRAADGEQVSSPAPAPAPAAAARAWVHSAPSRRWMGGFVTALVAALVAGAGLTLVGVQVLRESNAGRRVTSADPHEPGFEGLLEATPTMLVAHVDGGELRSAAVLALANDDAGGSVILLPPSVEVGDGEDAAPLSVTYAFDGTPEVLRGAGEAITGVGIQDVVVLDDARWAELVAPVGPLHLRNPDELEDFEAGDVALEPGQVAPWLEATRRGESELGHLYRQQLFWEAWVAAVASSDDPAAVPGELDSGIGRFVRGLAGGRLQVTTLPVTELTDAAGTTLYRADREVLRAVITQLVPFPTGTALAPRTRVRLLDGTGQAEHVRDVAPVVVASDATIVVVGNADTFEYERTEIRYHQPAQQAAAERLQLALGAGRVVEDVRPIDAFDVTIVLGTDT